MLERLLRTAVMWLASPGKQNNAILKLVSGESASWLEGKARIFVEDLPEPERMSWKDWLRQARTALDERNMLAHTSWMVSQDETTHGRRQRRGKVSVGERVAPVTL